MQKPDWLWVTALALCTTLTGALAQSTAFTYQGRLNDNGAPATGLYDFRFFAYNSSLSPTPVSGPTFVSAVPVTNGLFTVAIDFGAGVFTGAQRWLEIGVRTNGGAGYVTLEPRQAIAAVPYATHAATASNVVSGAAVKSVNGLKDEVTLAAGANVTITPNGNALTISSTGGGGGETNSLWSLNGASAYYNGGNVGIGTSTPAGLLDVAGGATDTSALYVRADPDSFGRGGIIHHQSSMYGWQELAQKTGSPTDGLLAFHYVERGAPGNKLAPTVLALRGNGSVGIGTEAPQTKLTVHSSLYGVEHTDGTVRLTTFLNGVAGWLGTRSNHKLNFFVNDGNASMTIDTAGNVGIGTNGPASKLDVRGHLTLDPGTSPVIYTAASGGEQNRYLQLVNSPEFSSAAGLKAGGLLVADSFGYANPGKNDLVVKGNVSAGGDASQARDKGGWVKAMAKVNADGTIARQYSALGGAITMRRLQFDFSYIVTFPFQVNDRFISVTPFYNGSVGQVIATVSLGCATCGPNEVLVSISDPETSDTSIANEFFIVVY